MESRVGRSYWTTRLRCFHQSDNAGDFGSFRKLSKSMGLKKRKLQILVRSVELLRLRRRASEDLRRDDFSDEGRRTLI